MREGDGSDTEDIGDLFPEPEGYYQPEPEPTFETFDRKHAKNGPMQLNIRLIGKHPLWAHYLWNAAKVLSDYFDMNPKDIRGKNVLELGAGGALPSLVAACNEAQKVVITDYPDNDLIENIKYNVEHCGIGKDVQERVVVEGYLWGSDATNILSHLGDNSKFDVIILSDTVFNHSEHNSLVKSLQLNLAKSKASKVYCFYTHHRPHLKDKDLEFFEIARQGGFVTEDLLKQDVVPMFPEDPGYELEGGFVYGKILRWYEV